MIVPHSTVNKTYSGHCVKVLPNGDGLIELDPEMIKDLGWKVGDKLDYEMKEGKIYITNLTRINNETK